MAASPFPEGPLNFALIGAAGFVAPRHMQAIRDTGHRLVAAVDPNDSVGSMDKYFPDAHFFTEIERFDRHLDKLRRGPNRIQCVSICSPNYLHDAHIRLALRLQAHAICEKPLVIKPWNLEQLEVLEQEYSRRVFTVLQLRLNPQVAKLREEVLAEPARKATVSLTYITRRGRWYDVSWKGSPERSGGLSMNIGVHFFDLLMWIFGRVERLEMHLSDPRRMAGLLELERAEVQWFLSVDGADLPAGGAQPAFRSLSVDGREIDLSEDFGSAHTKVYQEILAGRGPGVADIRPSIELVHAINTSPITVSPRRHHLLG